MRNPIAMETHGGRRRLAALLALGVLVGCASAGPPPPPAPGTAPAGGPDALEIRSVDLSEEAGIARVELVTSGPLVWTTYRDTDDNLVLELPNSRVGAGVSAPETASGLVASIDLRQEGTDARPLTRLVLTTSAAAEHAVLAEGDLLSVELTPLAAEWQAADAADAVDAPAEPVVPLPTDAVVEEPPVEAAEVEVSYPEVMVEEVAEEAAAAMPSDPYAEPVATTPAVSATQLLGVTVDASGQHLTILGDGEFYHSSFSLENPDRYVVDLVGVVNAAPRPTITVGSELVERVRIAQFKSQPEMVARVVVDLLQPTVPSVEPLADGLRLVFGDAAVVASDDPAPVPESEPTYESEAVAAYEAAPLGDPVESADYAAAEPAGMAEEPAAQGGDEPWGTTPEGYAEEAPAVPEPVAVAAVAAPAPVLEPAPQISPPDEPAVEMFEVGPPTSTAAPPPAPAPASSFQSRSFDEAERVYYGDPMTITLKDADIKDVLRSFAQISGLNIVVQPGVSGTVTVELTNVPWDQALEQVLKINNLGYQLEGNIMRIAPIPKLREEAEEQQRLAQAQALSIPLSTVMKRVSYADARAVAQLLRSGGGASLMSQRGSVVVDDRTNTLIIKELPAFMDTLITVIESLDTPEPQVMIEARIVETTKRFSRTLGITWGFTGDANQALGNTTGLVFPNNISATGGVNLPTGGNAGSLDISLGNVLNSFTLDATLTAAENDGLINILSAPRITTLNNQQASIQSGLQIPIQTVANNTVSVQFVNATLRLDVTPHVTAEGTVLMDINIQKREPQLAFAVAGAANAPIATRDARTRLIVRDGGTAVIGGIYEVSTDRGEDRVPGLSNVPILKHLFKNKRRNEENEELLIFITPRVVKL